MQIVFYFERSFIMSLQMKIKAELEKTTTSKKYSGVYAMGDAPICVRGLIKALERFDLDDMIEGVKPRNGGERLAVVLALFLHEYLPDGVDVKELAAVMRTVDGVRKPTLEGRGGADWSDIAINELIAKYLAPSEPTTTTTTKKGKKK
jgi:hypothetical protein